MKKIEKNLPQSKTNSGRCAVCPPDRICAWACEQGWSEVDVLVSNMVAAKDGVLDTAEDFIRQGIFESFS